MLVVILLTQAYLISSLIPIPCAKNFTNLGLNICCPIPNRYFHACGYPYRGECKLINWKQYSLSISPFQDDIRNNWPLQMFQYFCHCYKPFGGIDCGDCSFGYGGDNCLQRKVIKRKNIMNLNVRELQIFRDVVNLTRHEISNSMVMSETIYKYIGKPILIHASIYEVLVFVHQFVARPALKTGVLCENRNLFSEYTNYNHNGPGFLTWHRYFMLEWERLSADIAKKHFKIDDFTFPYWDWTDKQYCDVCTNEILGSPGNVFGYNRMLHWKSVFFNWTEICSINPSNPCQPCNLQNSHKSPISRAWIKEKFPTKFDVLRTLGLSTYYQSIYKQNFIFYKNVLMKFHNHFNPCDSFASSLEGSCMIDNEFSMHNMMHNMVIGTFHDTRTSVNDPLFILHHIQIDRLFELWLRNHKRSIQFQFPRYVMQHGQCYDCYMVGFLPPVKHKDFFKNSTNFGYDYDSFNIGKN